MRRKTLGTIVRPGVCAQYTLGLLWFWQTDPSTGQALHDEMSTLGFCTDEYVGDSGYPNDPPHWPYRLRGGTSARSISGLTEGYLWLAL